MFKIKHYNSILNSKLLLCLNLKTNICHQFNMFANIIIKSNKSKSIEQYLIIAQFLYF